MANDLAARFREYADAFERSYADGRWARVAAYFSADAVYECVAPESLAFRVVGRAAILERFATVCDAFDRRFDSRSMQIDELRVDAERVSVRGVVIYTLCDAPPLCLPFTETAEYRGEQIIRLEDGADAADVVAIATWMAQYGQRLGAPDREPEGDH
jgi:hypothetical protein